MRDGERLESMQPGGLNEQEMEFNVDPANQSNEPPIEPPIESPMESPMETPNLAPSEAAFDPGSADARRWRMKDLPSPVPTPTGESGMFCRGSTATPQSGFGWLFFSLQGRISRLVFWAAQLIWLASLIATVTLIGLLFDFPAAESKVGLTIVLILFCWAQLAISVKRFHDRGKSAIWLWICLVPLIGWLWLGVQLGLLPGSPEDDRLDLL